MGAAGLPNQRQQRFKLILPFECVKRKQALFSQQKFQAGRVLIPYDILIVINRTRVDSTSMGLVIWTLILIWTEVRGYVM